MLRIDKSWNGSYILSYVAVFEYCIYIVPLWSAKWTLIFSLKSCHFANNFLYAYVQICHSLSWTLMSFPVYDLPRFILFWKSHDSKYMGPLISEQSASGWRFNFKFVIVFKFGICFSHFWYMGLPFCSVTSLYCVFVNVSLVSLLIYFVTAMIKSVGYTYMRVV